ncbi:MAG TPA: AAA family ATPase [Kofleriaceae bacterium]
MLNRLRIKNFKLLRDVDLEVEGTGPTVLIGPNASGKSTVIEVLDFLGRCANDGLESALIAHGGMAAIRTVGSKDPIEIYSNWQFYNLDNSHSWDFHWTLCIDATPQGLFTIVSESLRDGNRDLLMTSDDGARFVIDESVSDDEGSQITNPRELGFMAFVDPKRYDRLHVFRVILMQIRALGALASAPPWARVSAERVSPRDAVIISNQQFVGREGVGLATALYNLQTDHHEAWDHLLRAFQAEFPSVKRIVFPPDPGGSRIFFAIEDERFPGRKIYASEMSDGMIVYLCLLSLILHPHQRAVLALDEPDAHLHPSAVRRLMALAHQPAERHLIIVTHSNALLDELRDPAASIRVVEITKDGARIRKLDAAALETWRSEYTLSDLRRTGLLDPTNTAYETDP